MTLPARLRQLQRDTGGTALIELALLAPLLISLMCGLAEFGQVLRQYHVMQKGVQDAAHYLARAPSDPCAAGGPDANWATYVGEAKNLAIYGKTTSGTPLYKGWTSPATVAVPNPACLANPRTNGSQLPQITVTANAPYVDLGMLTVLGFGPITLRVSHQELKVS
jgi:Flp pilus assembly protein TadG